MRDGRTGYQCGGRPAHEAAAIRRRAGAERAPWPGPANARPRLLFRGSAPPPGQPSADGALHRLAGRHAFQGGEVQVLGETVVTEVAFLERGPAVEDERLPERSDSMLADTFCRARRCSLRRLPRRPRALLHRLAKKALVHDRRTVEVWYGLPNRQRFDGCDKSSRGGTRTPDPVINSHLLYHLSYSGIRKKYGKGGSGGSRNGTGKPVAAPPAHPGASGPHIPGA